MGFWLFVLWHGSSRCNVLDLFLANRDLLLDLNLLMINIVFVIGSRKTNPSQLGKQKEMLSNFQVRMLGTPMLRAIARHMDRSLRELDRLRSEPCRCVKDVFPGDASGISRGPVACDHDISDMCHGVFSAVRAQLASEMIRRARVILSRPAMGSSAAGDALPVDYEPCAVCGFDHCYEPDESSACPGVRS